MTSHIFIAGPCAVESKEQVLNTAAQLPADKVTFFRAGLWKPRTSPNSFQGVGQEGIAWLIEVREKYGLKIATEVATAEHVRLCRDAGFDALWIGARTVSDPFAMQTLCDALKGYEGFVLVKNPISDDIDLWEGAIQRLQMSGIQKIIAVHRGIKPSAYQPTELRNNPAWYMAVELCRRLPNIPIVCDPSHISGKAGLVPLIAQHAMSLGLDGLMVEVHYQPDKALSDKEQQLTPQQFAEMIDTISFRQQSTAENDLLQLREQIDSIDNQLWQLIEQRMTISNQIGEIKRRNDMPVFQPERYNKILKQRLLWAEQHGINRNLVQTITQILHDASIQRQM